MSKRTIKAAIWRHIRKELQPGPDQSDPDQPLYDAIKSFFTSLKNLLKAINILK